MVLAMRIAFLTMIIQYLEKVGYLEIIMFVVNQGQMGVVKYYQRQNGRGYGQTVKKKMEINVITPQQTKPRV